MKEQVILPSYGGPKNNNGFTEYAGYGIGYDSGYGYGYGYGNLMSFGASTGGGWGNGFFYVSPFAVYPLHLLFR